MKISTAETLFTADTVMCTKKMCFTGHGEEGVHLIDVCFLMYIS